MKSYIVRETKNKGKGLFATCRIKPGEHLLHVDLIKLKKYSLKEIESNPKLDGDHSNYVGRGKYVVEHFPSSYMNHSCEPNCYFKYTRIGIFDVYAMREIDKGEELAHDYTAAAIDQFGGKGFWQMKCHCGSKHCRGTVTGDFFDLPLELQKQYFPNLPPSVRRKYRKGFRK